MSYGIDYRSLFALIVGMIGGLAIGARIEALRQRRAGRRDWIERRLLRGRWL